MSKNRSIENLPLDGGCIVFHFVNTVHSRVEENIHDYIYSYEDFIEWMEKVKLLPVEKLKNLKALALADKKSAEIALHGIINKRELLYNFFSPIINNKAPEVSIIKSFNKTLSNSLSALSFSYNNGELELGWENTKPDFYEPLKIIFKDAFDIIITIPKNRFKECKACGWLFIDKSKKQQPYLVQHANLRKY